MIQVLQPDLPSAADLLPYLERIDRSKVATNGGQLVCELEARLGGIAVANATLGLELACQYIWGQGEVRVPAFTFPATATAVIRAGLTPVLCDVREDTWAAVADDRTLAVCPFGYPADGPLIDAAGAYGIQHHGNRVMSFHATKPLPAGEGGMVFGDEGLKDYVRRARNFGLADGTSLDARGTNAKMSEYHAAVTLASLDRFEQVDKRRRQLAYRYGNNLTGRIETRAYAGGTMFPVFLPDPVGASRLLAAAGYETRRWYCPTLDMHPAFERCRRDPLPVAHGLAKRLLCLTFHTFMTERDVDRVCEVLCESL